MRRVGEETFTPDHFTREGFDTTPYLMPEYEIVTFPARDGIELSGFFIPSPVSATESQETIIVVHGFNDCKRRAISLLPAGMLHRNGFNVLVMDLRNHGDSARDTGRMTAGRLEALDVLGAWDWLIANRGVPAEKIGVMGYSMGGASTLIAMAQEPRIRAGWTDAAYANIDIVLQNELQKAGLPTFLSSTALQVGRWVYGVDLLEITAQEALGQLQDRPLYIVHSMTDESVPFASVDMLLTSAQDADQTQVQSWTVEDSLHVLTMFDYAEKYEAEMVRFFRESLR